MANGYCPASCATDELIINPPAECETVLREKTVSNLAFMLCSSELPEPMVEAAFKAMVDSGEIAISSEIRNFNAADPTTEEIILSDCKPARNVVRGRNYEFEDVIKLTETTGSPAITNLFKDYEVWDDKILKSFQLRVMTIYCDGDVVPAKDRNGNWLAVDVQGFITYQRSSTQGAASIEVKKFVVKFNNDPIAFYNTPVVNLFDALVW